MTNRNFAVPLIILISAVSGFSQMTGSISEAAAAAQEQTRNINHRSFDLERVRNDGARDDLAAQNNNKKFPEIKDDFERIQAINTNRLQINAVKDNPDYKAMQKAALEIKKRATSLKNNLFPNNSDKGSGNALEVKELEILSKLDLKALNIGLDNTIFRFVSNGIFKNIKVVNPDDSQKAEHDLESIIKLCTLIDAKIMQMQN